MEALLAAAKYGRADSYQLGALIESEISKYVHTVHVHTLYIVGEDDQQSHDPSDSVQIFDSPLVIEGRGITASQMRRYLVVGKQRTVQYSTVQ